MVTYDSGPYCRHYSDPSECEDVCSWCGHRCADHQFGIPQQGKPIKHERSAPHILLESTGTTWKGGGCDECSCEDYREGLASWEEEEQADFIQKRDA